MKLKKNSLITLFLFLAIIVFGYFALPLMLQFITPETIIEEKIEITDEIKEASNNIVSIVFDPLKSENMATELTDQKELGILFNYIDYNVENIDFIFPLFNDGSKFYGNQTQNYLNNEYIVGISEDINANTSYVFSPYSFYIPEHVVRPFSQPNPAQVSSAYAKLQKESIYSEDLIAYASEIDDWMNLFAYNNTSYISNMLYSNMYSSQPKNRKSIISYNYTISYSFLDCIDIGERTIQFDGTLFAITYFVEKYGVILYYNPISDSYCGYSIQNSNIFY